jgi:trans-aconitate methyltransferase
LTLKEAIDLIRAGVKPNRGTWADIGAGTGMFTLALMEILKAGKIIATDKNPHALYNISAPPHVAYEILEADFHQPLPLPPLQGIIMANSLHYAKDHESVLNNVLESLRSAGTFILIEYDTDRPNHPWVPNPVSVERFRSLCRKLDLQEPMEIGRIKSIYDDGPIYSAVTHWRTKE